MGIQNKRPASCSTRTNCSTPARSASTQKTQNDPLLNARVFIKDTAVAKIGNEVIDKYKYLSFPAKVEDVQGDWLWLDRAWVQRSQVMMLDQAFNYYFEQVRINPRSSRLWLGRAACWHAKGDLTNAIKDYDEAIRLEPKSFRAYINRGTAKSELQQYQGAVKDYDEAIRLDPKFAKAFYGRGIVKHSIADYQGAISDYDEAIRLEPKYTAAYINRGIAKDDLKDYHAAITDYSEAIRFDARYTVAYTSRAKAKRLLKDYQGAIEDLDQAIRLDPKSAHAYSSRGWIHVYLKQYSSANSDFDAAIRLDSKHIYARNNKSFLLSTCPDTSIRNTKEALEIAEDVLAEDPQNAYAMNAKSCALAAAGDFDSAIQWQRKALENSDWTKSEDLDGGIDANARIKNWQAKELWLLPD